MIRAWEEIIEPLARAAQVRSILEIGSEIGLSTRVLVNYVSRIAGHLHTIDPSPSFDVAALAREHEGFLTYYLDLSLNALRNTPPVDLALVDGDHNWYTVFHELRLLEERHGHEADGMPMIVVHDTGWPYGRRDLYYDPETIPGEYRQPFSQEGIGLNKDRLVGKRGMNQHLYNAVDAGGARNGVMTAVEDYLEQSTMPWHAVHLPLYFGLSILVTESKLAEHSALAAAVESLEGQLAGRDLIAFGERLRLAEGVAYQKLQRELDATKQRVAELEARLKETESTERHA